VGGHTFEVKQSSAVLSTAPAVGSSLFGAPRVEL
jgi:hypothetical protein